MKKFIEITNKEKIGTSIKILVDLNKIIAIEKYKNCTDYNSYQLRLYTDNHCFVYTNLTVKESEKLYQKFKNRIKIIRDNI